MPEFVAYNKNVKIKDELDILDVTISKEVLHRSIDVAEPIAPSTPPLAVTAIGVNNTEAPLLHKSYNDTCFTDIDVQELYLRENPPCYLILNKPGLGAFSIGETISKKQNCIHLCPKNLLQDEIDQQSSTGKCLQFNMQHNRVCSFTHLLLLLKEKIKSPAVKHRGYVMSGFPMILANSTKKYFVKPLVSEESVRLSEEVVDEFLLNLKKKKTKGKGEQNLSVSNLGEEDDDNENEEEEELELGNADEEEEVIVELPKFILETCSDVILQEKPVYKTVKAVHLEQFEEIMNLTMKPTIVIYLTCPDADVITKIKNKSFNYANSNYVIDTFPRKTSTNTEWPLQYSIDEFISPTDRSFPPSKYGCKMPLNFHNNSTKQLCNYMEHIYYNVIEKLKDFDPKYIIQIDGRLSIHESTQNILERLLYLPIPHVVIPEPLYLQDPPDDLEEFWRSVEEMNIIRSGAVIFRRNPSPWVNRCPVQLKKRISVIGKPKFAVTFFNHVYLLSSLDSLIKFCRNPRPYLKIEYLEPTCRIIVCGSRLTGKTMVSQCLSWIFDAHVIDYKLFLNEQQKQKYYHHAEQILPQIIGTVEQARFNKWEGDEQTRNNSLNKWFNHTKLALKKYMFLLNKYTVQQELTANDNPAQIEDEVTLDSVLKAKEELLEFPFIDNIEDCKNVFNDKDLMMKYAPINLITETPKPLVPLIDDFDVKESIMAYIAANDLQKEIDPSAFELITEISTIIADLDNKVCEETSNDKQYGKWIIDGFPTEQEFWALLNDKDLMPDYTIMLVENRDIDDDIISSYINIQRVAKNYAERFQMIDDPLLNIRRLTKSSKEDIELDMNIIALDILQAVWSESDLAQEASTLTTYFTESLELLREDCNAIKSMLDAKFKLYVEVEMGQTSEEEGGGEIKTEKTDLQIMEEVLTKFRQTYCLNCTPNDDDHQEPDEDEDTPKDVLSNDKSFLCETGHYCPIAFKDYGVLWEGKPDFTLKYNNKVNFFCKEKFIELFKSDPTKYQFYANPFKNIRKPRICIVGCIGSGRSTLSRLIAKELGLMHLDFTECLNDLLIPKHFQKVGRKYENIFVDVPYADETASDAQVDVDEENLDMESNLLSNEMALRRMVFNYLENGSPLQPQFSRKIIKELWFDRPYEENGFVLDGYPKVAADVDDMVASFCTPDLIIELESSSEDSVSRLSQGMFKTWKEQLSVAKNVALKKIMYLKKEWLQSFMKDVVVKVILEDTIDEVCGHEQPTRSSVAYASILNESETEEPKPDAFAEMNTHLFKIYNEYIEQFPEPKDENVWENSEAARDRINARIEAVYEIDNEHLQGLKDMLSENNIKIIAINGSKPVDKVFRSTLSKLSNIRNRNQSYLEQTFVINVDMAEILLMEGFCFLSKFYRMCPVYFYENPDCIQNPYKFSKKKNTVYPILHRSYLYFICNEENVKKFRNDPLKYILRNDIKFYIEFPFGIGVIGPPKSGKSSLVASIAKRYSMLPLSRGFCIRYILENMYWTELGMKISAKLTMGEMISYDLISAAVQTFVIVHHIHKTYGFICDGFPETPAEALQLSKDGLFPLIVIDLNCSKNKCISNSQNEKHVEILKYTPPFSSPLISLKYSMWKKTSYKVKDWIKDNYNSIETVDGNTSRWQILKDSLRVISNSKPKISYYLKHVNHNAVPAEAMNISKDSFLNRMTGFKDFCPVCFHQNTLLSSNYPEKKDGLIIYDNAFYCVCTEHLESVLKDPWRYLDDKFIEIPEVPVHVNNIDLTQVYENGVCIVTYAEGLPLQNIVRGDTKLAANYEKKTYLFCSPDCMSKFMQKPHLYHDIVIFRHMNLLPVINLSTLPNLGYLEQTLGIVLTEACCDVNVARPKYPGLSIELSGLIYIALYMKVKSPDTDPLALPLYKRAFKTYVARCKVVMDTARRVPVPDERFDYLCEYHKPASKVPAFLNVVDIAGLVKGAAEGQGLGNAFLSHIKACDAIFNLCRAFDDEDVIHVDGEVNPVRDLETIGEELRLKDEDQLIKDIEKLDRVVNRGNDKKLKPEYDTLLKIKSILVDEKKHIRFGDWSANDIEILNKYLFLTSKPALYLVNLSEKDYIRKKNKWLPKLKEWIDKNDPGAPLIPFSGVFEYKLLEMEPEERKAFLKENNVTSALDKIIVQGYKALQLEYFFTAGADEVKAWTIQKGTKAPQAAGRIHTDFEKGFIMAEVMHFKDFKEEGTEAACKAAGKYRQQGRNYVVEDGDIIFFKFNAGAGLKDAKKK